MNVDQWLESLRAAWLEQDAAGVSRLFAEDADYRQGPFGTPRRGRAEIAAHWKETLSHQEEQSVRFGRPLVAGDRAAVEFWVVARDPDSGEQRTAAGCVMLRFDAAGRCAELHEYWHGTPGAVEPAFAQLRAGAVGREGGTS